MNDVITENGELITSMIRFEACGENYKASRQLRVTIIHVEARVIMVIPGEEIICSELSNVGESLLNASKKGEIFVVILSFGEILIVVKQLKLASVSLFRPW